MYAIITGATKGIGRAIAEIFVKNDIHVAICSRNEADLVECKAALLELNQNVEVLAIQADMSQKESIQSFVSTIEKSWVQVDILVNNAGIYFPGEVYQEEEGVLEKMLELNLMGPYRLTRKLMPYFLKQESGFIFNICSVAGIKPYPNGGSYSITKYALNGFSKSLREELKDKGIKVCTVFPGATWSHSWEGMRGQIEDSRLMEAEDVAKAVYLQLQLSPSTVMEDIILRPQLGDL